MKVPQIALLAFAVACGGLNYGLGTRIDDAKKAAQKLWGQGLLTVIVGRAPQAAAQPVAAPPKAN